MSRLNILLTMMYALGMKILYDNEGLPKINEKIVNPAQSEEQKQTALKKAEEKREKRRLKRIKNVN
jgi:hypothetical protein